MAATGLSAGPSAGPPGWGVGVWGWAALVLALLAGCTSMRPPWRTGRDMLAARQLTRQAITAMRQQDWELAERSLTEAVQRCPSDEEARRQYADLLWRQGRLSDAVDQLEVAVRLCEPPDPAMLIRLGQMHLARGEIDSAERVVGQAVAVGADHAPAWRLWGQVAQRRGESDRALRAYLRALSLDPLDLPARLAVAEIYLDHDRAGRALGTLSRLEGSTPTQAVPGSYWELKGRALLAMGRAGDAIEAFERAVGMGHRSAPLLAQLARAYQMTGDWQGAEQAVQLARHGLPLEQWQRFQAIQQAHVARPESSAVRPAAY